MIFQKHEPLVWDSQYMLAGRRIQLRHVAKLESDFEAGLRANADWLN